MYIYPSYYQYQNSNIHPVRKTVSTSQVAFTGIRAEKSIQKGEYFLRIIANKFSDLLQGKKAKELTKAISEVTPEATEQYLQQLELISRLYSSNKIIDVNTEDKILEHIAKKGKSVIFVMNHSNQSEDPQLLAFLNTMLTKAYKQAGKTHDFPLPKIILNQDILTTMNPTKRKAFEAFGAVGVDANIASRDSSVNARAMIPLIKDFIQDKCNIFIFPEGRKAIRKDLELHQRFQTGIGEMINKILGIKKEVTVVPVGFSYGKGEQKDLAGIHIGTPVNFKRENDITTTTTGDLLDTEFPSKAYADFFEKHKEEGDIAITEAGKPVGRKKIADFIKDILSDNLEICVKKANKQLTVEDNDILLY